jgi:3-oxoacyl-[acyl-carrier protein] reductase
MLLENKVALVTGAALGIGAGIAEMFAAHGAIVYLLDIDLVAAQKRAAWITSQRGMAHALACDVSQRADLSAAVDTAVADHGRVDILVNNAGIYPRKAFLKTTEADWDRMQEVNVKSMYHACQLVLPSMIQQRSGRIINISSVTVWLGVENLVHYVSSKAAAVGFTRSLAREVGAYNIHVNCVTPGAIQTEGENVHADPKIIAGIVEQQSHKRRILPSDVAGACVFLASELSNGMTGQALNVDGGLVMH